MQVVILESAEDTGAYAAALVRKGIANGSIKVLGLATGSSPLPLYRALESDPIGGLDQLTTFALDEYVGLPAEHRQSYRAVLEREVVLPLGLDSARVHVPDGTATDPEQACRDYEQGITDAGGVDFQILGIGTDGHIGFNEPTSSMASRTRIKTLTQDTRTENARFFDRLEDVPTHCLTQGLGTILEARKVVLMAHGSHKAAAVAAAVEGPITSMCPASILQMHPDATIVLDEDAAADLTMRDYYDYVLANLPQSQRHLPQPWQSLPESQPNRPESQ